jgi:hypothetical protein
MDMVWIGVRWMKTCVAPDEKKRLGARLDEIFCAGAPKYRLGSL